MSILDLSNSFKVKSDGAVELPLYDFLLMFIVTYGVTSASLQNIRF